MSILNPRSAAEASDALATLTAAASGVAAVVYSINVIEVFVSGSTAELLGYAQMAGVVLIIGVLAPMLILLKRRGAEQGAGGSYFGALLRQVALTAFSVTLGFMIALSVLERRVLAHLSAENTVDLLVGFALAAFAVSFFFIDRFGHVEEGGEEDG